MRVASGRPRVRAGQRRAVAPVDSRRRGTGGSTESAGPSLTTTSGVCDSWARTATALEENAAQCALRGQNHTVLATLVAQRQQSASEVVYPCVITRFGRRSTAWTGPLATRQRPVRGLRLHFMQGCQPLRRTLVAAPARMAVGTPRSHAAAAAAAAPRPTPGPGAAASRELAELTAALNTVSLRRAGGVGARPGSGSKRADSLATPASAARWAWGQQCSGSRRRPGSAAGTGPALRALSEHADLAGMQGSSMCLAPHGCRQCRPVRAQTTPPPRGAIHTTHP